MLMETMYFLKINLNITDTFLPLPSLYPPEITSPQDIYCSLTITNKTVTLNKHPIDSIHFNFSCSSFIYTDDASHILNRNFK